jgi:hypothetical protein
MDEKLPYKSYDQQAYFVINVMDIGYGLDMKYLPQISLKPLSIACTLIERYWIGLHGVSKGRNTMSCTRI